MKDPADKTKPFMPMRDGAGSFSLDHPDDGTPITETFALKDRLLLMTEKCTYEVQLADQIDPDGKNPNLPHNVRRKMFDYGTKSQPLCKILLQSKALFKDGFLPIDVEAAQQSALVAMQEFAAMDHAMNGFKNLEQDAISKVETINQQPRSFALPSIGSVDTHCKTFAQKAHHFGRALFSIARIFLPAATNWDKLDELARSRYGPEDNFSKLLAETIPNLKMVLHLRDALEHQNKSVVVRDFTMEHDGTVAPPTVELDFRKSVLPRVTVTSLMEGLVSALPDYFEMVVAHLSSKFVLPVGGLPIFVDTLPDEYQRTQCVRFGYCVMMGEQKVPFG